MFDNVYGSGDPVSVCGFVLQAHTEGEWEEMDRCAGDPPSIWTPDLFITVRTESGDDVGVIDRIDIAYSADGFDCCVQDVQIFDACFNESSAAELFGADAPAVMSAVSAAVESLLDSIESECSMFLETLERG